MRRLAFLGTVAALLATLFVQACTSREVIGVVVSSVTVAPANARLLEGDTVTFTATVMDDRGRPVPAASDDVTWSTDDPSKIEIGPDGRARALRHGTAIVRASIHGVSGTAPVTVIPAPEIALATSAVTFYGGIGQAPPAPQGVAVTNSGGGTLGGLAASVGYREGEPTGWLAVALSGSAAPSTLTVTVQTAGLSVGRYSATVTVSSPDDRTGPATLAVTLVLTGITILESGGSTAVDESGSTDDFAVALAAQPASDVVITITSTDPTEVTASPVVLTFTPTSWNVSQTVTVRGVDDDVADGDVVTPVTVTVDRAASDSAFAALAPRSVLVTTRDDDAAGITVTPASGLVTTETRGQATFTVRLTSAPTATVTISLSSSDLTEGTVSPASLTFTPANWNIPQTVTVTGVNDDIDDGDVVYTIVTAPATSADPNYNGLNAPDVSVTNRDDGDIAGVTVVPTTGLVTSEAGAQAAFALVLTSQPLADVTIRLSSSNTSEGTVSPPSLTFTPANWNVPRTVTVTGVDDDVADGNVVYTIVTSPATSADPKYSGLDPADVSVTNVDDDTAGFTVSPPNGPTTEAGGQTTFTVVLNNRPAANVTIGLSSSDTSEGTISASSLTFTPANWSVPQIVTVTGVDDDIDDGDVVYTIVTAPATSADPNYNGLNPADVSITNVDDDTAGFAVSPPSGPTTEAGGQATFTVRLTSQPLANVTIGLSSSDTSEGTVSPSSLTFTPANWNVPRTVTVTGVDDDVADGNVVYTIVTSPATSADPKYSGLDPADVSVTNVDNETPGITVGPVSGPTTEAGGQATFSVVLNTRPNADVTIGLSSSDTSEGTVSPSSLTFTPANWNVPRTVTVTGVNDDIDDGDVVYTIVTSPATSADPNYNGLNPADVSVTNVDDDTAGFAVSPPSGPTTETGGQATFTVRLTSQPLADVTIGLSSSDTGEGTVSPSSLTFTPANWNVPRTVTVTGVDDDVADGNVVYTIVTSPATSADPKYNGLNPADVSVTNVDNETPGITVGPVSGPTTEAGGQATFSVVLNTRPNADVTIGLSSSDTSEGTVSPSSLTFTPANWNVPRTVTVTGVNDDIDDDNVVYTIVTSPATSADPNYNGLNPADVSITNVDDDTAGFAVSPPSGPTTEAGGQATFTVRLTSQPLADVTIGLSSSDTGEGTVSPSSLAFTPANWNVPRTVTVTGVDDDVADGNVVYTIVTSPATSADPKYNGLNPADVSVTNVDNETPGITVGPVSGPTTEAGGQATFSVVLNTRPNADVTIGLSSSDTGEGTISASSLTFTPANWNILQTVTVTGVNDDIDDDDVVYTIVTSPATSADPNYNGLNPADVSVTNVDDDTAGFAVSPPSGPTTEAGGQATFTVRLTSQPLANVTIGLSSSDTSEGTVSPSSLTFTPANWNVPRTVTVTGVDDDVADGNVVYTIVTSPATSADPKYSGLDPADVSVTNVDNETPGITVGPVSGPTTEAGGQATFSVVLNTRPNADVTIGLSSSNTSEGTISASSLTFTPANWSVPQIVTVTGVDDDIDDDNVVYTIVTAPATSADPNYNGLDPADVSITNVDDDTAGFAVSPPSGPTTETGGQATFTVRLTSQPLADVTIGLSSSDTSEGTVSPSSLTFTPANWNVPRTVTVTGVDDDVADGNVVYTIVTSPATSADPKYNGLNPADVSVTNVDNETPGITVGPVSGPTTEAGGQATFSVVLNTRPNADVTIGLSSSNTSEGTISASSLTFTPANWNILQTVTVTGVNDDIDDDDVVYTIVTSPATSADPNYSGLDPADVSVTNVDDDTAGFAVSPPSGPTTEAGGQATFTVRLTSQPLANVTIGLSSSDTSEGTVSPSSLTFTPANWNVPRTVTVTGVDDDVADGNVVYTIVTSPATSADPKYNGLNPADVSVTNVDNETPGITVGPVSGPTTEAGGQATFSVVLNTRPNADVTIGLSSSDTSEGTVSPSSLTFTPANWNVPRTVTVTGVNDDIDDDDVVYTIVTSPATSADPNYNGLNPADVSVTNVDDDTAGFAVSPPSGPTTEAGGQATFTVRLTSQPLADVTIGLSSSDTGEGTVSPSSLAFTPANWSVPQIVTVTGVDDDVADGNVVYTIVTSPATSADPKYNGLNPADVSITNVDDDTAGFAVSPPSGPTTETGGQATFTVRLTSQPLANVTIGLSSSNTGEGTVSPSSLAFTPANWSVPQIVTVTGVDDDIDDDDVVYTIVTAPATSADPNYNGLNPADVSVTNVDDDTAGFAVSPLSGPTTEAGGQATFTVRLTSQPLANVTIGLSSSNTGEGTVSPSSLAFTPANWSVPQIVTVTGVDDDIDDDDVVYTIVTAPATSADPNYNGLNPADVSVTNVDDDTAGFAVSPPSGPTTEAGGQATFTVRLTSQPLANVTIGLSSSDTSEGTVSPSSLTFTPANWNVPRTVTVTGVDDDVADGNVVYTIVTAPATSADPKYNGLNPADVSVTNVDNETPGITVGPVSGPTTEAGGQATFSVVLNTRPNADVTIGLSSSDTSEGTVSPSSLTFTPANWSVPQIVTVTGVDDDIDDDNVVYTIVTSPATSADPNYSGLNPADVSITNVDDDTAGFAVSPPSGPTTETGGQATFTVRLTSQPLADVTIGLSSSDTSEGTVSPSSLTFTPANWSVPQIVTVTGVDDLIDDGHVTYTIVTAPATSADPKYNGLNPADVSITNVNDDRAALSIGDVTVTEGNTGSVNATFTVTLAPASARTVTVGYATSNGTAVAPGDYTETSGTLTFAPGVTSQTITVPVLGDLLDEDDETFNVTLSGATNATIADNTGVGTIVDDDPLPALSIDDATVTEGNTGSVNATFTVTLAPASGRTVTVGYATSNGTALTPGDYTETSGTLTFAPGVTSQTITVPVLGDVLDEDDETFNVTLSGATNATIADNTGVGTITDDDPLPALSIGDVTVTEGNTGSVNATFTVTLAPASGRTVTVGYFAENVTAVAPGDYTATSGTLTFAPGVTSRTITVPVLGDLLDEDDETFNVTLSGATNATIADNTGVGTIADDDTATLSIDDVTVTEGNTGSVNATFTVTKTLQSSQTVTVQFATEDVTALAPADYTATSGTLTFMPGGPLTQTITVPVLGDVLDEDDETFDVRLENAVNATIADDKGIGTITDDDPLPALSIGDATEAEGNTGSVNVTFTVTLAPASGRTVTVQYFTQNVTAVAPGDYTETSGTLTFAPGVTSQTITVPVLGDVLDEDDETFDVRLENAVNATIADDKGIGTIVDDDPLPTLSVNDTTVTEGDAGTVSSTFTVTLAPASGRTVTVQYFTQNVTAVAPGDYTETSGTLTFAPGVTSQTITVPVLGDVLDEDDETFDVRLENAVNATIADDKGIGTIVDDDPLPTLSVNDTTVTEGDAGTVSSTFTVTLAPASGRTVTVQYFTQNVTAVAPGDYTETSGTLTFAPGVTSQTITVPVLGDVLDEDDETFDVRLENAINATIADDKGIGTIVDDDPLPTLSVNDTTVTEGDAGTVSATFTVTLAPASGRTVTVQYFTQNVTAVAPGDYTAASGTLTFAPGVTSQTITVPVLGDVLDEDDETFDVRLENAVNATIADDKGIGTIVDDDPLPTLSVNDTTVTEGDAGTVSATFTVTLAPASGRTVTVQYFTQNVTAVAPGDYTETSGTLTFAPGVTSQTITVPVLGDVLDEDDETFDVRLENAINATIADDKGIGTIVDDDPLPTLSVNDTTVTEGDAGTVSSTFTVTLAPASGRTVTVQYFTQNVTAVAPGDYTETSGTLTFAPGVTSQTITVPVLGDVLDEDDETFDVRLENAINATIADDKGIGTIVDDDPLPTLSVNDTTVTEGDAGTVSSTFTVTLAPASGRTVTVQYFTQNVTAVAPGDYTETSGTLTFAPGVTSQTITVPVLGDVLDEDDETFDVRLENAINATIADDKGIGTIVDDDPLPTLSVNDTTVTEGDAGTVSATFTVTLAPASGRTVTVQYFTQNVTAVAPGDYTETSGTLTFAPGVTSQTITVPVLGDVLDEDDETFDVRLENAVNATIADDKGIGTIVDDDPLPTLSVNDTTVTEGDAGTVSATFTVTLAPASGRTVTVQYFTQNVTAVAPGDYTETSGTLTFAPGVTSQTITVPVLGDVLDEDDETFDVRLENAVNATIADDKGIGTIVDDDP